MAGKKGATPVFDITAIQRKARHVWREIERDDDTPLRVKLRDLSIAEIEEIPVTRTSSLADAFKAAASYIVEWDFEAENKETGDTIPVPPPADAGWEVLELLSEAEAGAILAWLKHPTNMKLMQEKKNNEGK